MREESLLSNSVVSITDGARYGMECAEGSLKSKYNNNIGT